MDAETAIIGDSIYNVTATDGEGDIVTFSMTCDTGGSTNTDTFRMLASEFFFCLYHGTKIVLYKQN